MLLVTADFKSYKSGRDMRLFDDSIAAHRNAVATVNHNEAQRMALAQLSFTKDA